MKMRKKLAALLAAAMIASVMPMTAFAASDNRVSKIVKVVENEPLKKEDRPDLRIKLKDGMSSDHSFYLILDGAEWLAEDQDTNQATANKIKNEFFNVEGNKKINGIETVKGDFDFEFEGDDLKITANKEVAVDAVLVFTLATFIEDGEATIEVFGHNSPVDDGTYIFAKTSDDYSVDLIVDDADDFATKGDVAEITIKEPFRDAFKKNAPKDKDDKVIPYTFTLELRDSDFEFVLDGKKDKDGKTKDSVITGKKGFTGKNKIEYAVVNGKTVTDMILVTVPSVSSASSMGEFVMENIEVKAKRNAAKGEVRATARNVDGKLLNGSQNFVIANHTDYSSKLKMNKDYEVLTGREVEVKFTLAENVEGSLVTNRRVEFNLPKGVKFKDDIEVKAVKSSKETDAKSLKVDMDTTNNKYDNFEFDGFQPKKDEIGAYEFEATLLVANSFDQDEIILTAEGNAIGETLEVVAAKVVKAVDVDVTPIDIKVGLRNQVGGKIVIKENAKEAILRNYSDENKNTFKDAEIEILIDDGRDDGLKITDADIKVTEGDLVLDLDAKVVSGGMITIPVKRQSTKPSTIEITNIEVTANRSVPEGKYEIKVGGAALSKNTKLYEFTSDNTFKDDFYGSDSVYVDSSGKTVVNSTKTFMDPVAIKEFINITTKNTEDFTGTTAAKVAFVLGSNQYIINGVAKDMDAAPFVKDGRTMVPVRYVAQALGVSEEQVAWDQATQTVTVIADKVIQVKLGSKTMVLNGANVPMTAAAELVSDRTFVPIAEIARALNVNVVWDDATKTATFN